MSIPLRRWGIAIGLVLAFALPHPATEAQIAPQEATPATGEAPAAGIQQVLDLRITAYTSLPDETDDTPFITADGDHVRDGIVATNILPFGTKVTIPSLFGDKVFTVDDRMNAKYRDDMDIWMSTWIAAVRFGVHDAEVVVFAPGANVASAAADTGAGTGSNNSLTLANAILADDAVAMATGSRSPGPSVRQL